MNNNRKHISEEERKRSKVMTILVGVLVLIAVIIIIMFIPKGNSKDNNAEQAKANGSGSTQDTSNGDSNSGSDSKNSNSTGKDGQLLAKDKKKVNITIKDGTLTVDGAVIVITDTNETPYSWSPVYRLQQKVDGKWQDMKLQNPENAIFADIEDDNSTGITEQSLVWGNKYGSLGTGTYRVVKESGGNEFYAEFEVE